MTEEEKREWDNWLAGLPDEVQEVARRLVPWKMYLDTRITEDIGNRYIPVSYEIETDGTVSVTCVKTNDEFLLFGGCCVFGIPPDVLTEE